MIIKEPTELTFEGTSVRFEPKFTLDTLADDPSLLGPGQELVGIVYPSGIASDDAGYRELAIYLAGEMRYSSADYSETMRNGYDLGCWLEAEGYGNTNAGLEKAQSSEALICDNNCWYEIYDKTEEYETEIVEFSILGIIEQAAAYLTTVEQV